MSRHIPISEIAAVVYRRFPDDLVKALVMVEPLEAYFDDSGTHGESLVTIISGFMASAAVWKKTETAWRSALDDYKRYGVTWYHATDVYACDGEWRTAPVNVCRIAPMQFAAVLGKQNVLPVWAAVVNEDFHRFATPEFLEAFPTPFDLCFHEAMGQLYHWARGEVKAPRVVPCVAHGDYTDRIVAAHRRYLVDGDFSAFVGPLVIDSPRRVVPLQTADLLAHEFYHLWKETEYPSQPLSYIDRPVLYKAIERNESAQLGVCYSGPGLAARVAWHTERLRKRKGGRPES